MKCGGKLNYKCYKIQRQRVGVPAGKMFGFIAELQQWQKNFQCDTLVSLIPFPVHFLNGKCFSWSSHSHSFLSKYKIVKLIKRIDRWQVHSKLHSGRFWGKGCMVDYVF